MAQNLAQKPGQMTDGQTAQQRKRQFTRSHYIFGSTFQKIWLQQLKSGNQFQRRGKVININNAQQQQIQQPSTSHAPAQLHPPPPVAATAAASIGISKYTIISCEPNQSLKY